MSHDGPGTCQLIRQAKTATEVELLRWEGKNTKTEASDATKRRWERLADRRLGEIERSKIDEQKAAEAKVKKETKS